MSTQEPGRAQPGLTALPRIEDLPASTEGYDRAKVQEAFDAFRRHVTSLQANLRVLQAAPKSAIAEPSGHAVRMDALHIVRAAAEFADTIERDAQEAAAKQVGRAEQEIREKQMELQQQEAEIARIRQETERHHATELTNSARAEVEQTLEWARAQADVIVQRARMGAEQLLSAAGHGDPAVHEAVDAIVRAAEATVEAQRGPQVPEGRQATEARAQAPSESPVAPSSPEPPAPEDEAPVVEPDEDAEVDRPHEDERSGP